MSDQGSNPGTPAEPGSRWAPHGQLLTACLVALNVFVILLIYFCFWRVLSWKRAASSAVDAASSAGTSPAASPGTQTRREFGQAVASQLPVFVHPGTDGGKAECAVCIVEFRDGDKGRLLPRCGHRFHVGCVDMWLQFHATCPLCRASVVAATDAKDSSPV